MNNHTPLVALIGNPNAGKTALFNALTGLNHKVSNYPGVTVERRVGKAQIEGAMVNIMDLPGTYSLIPESQDEAIVADEVNKWSRMVEKPVCIISVVDSTNLNRNLYLTSQLLDLGIPVLVALNMTDLARKKSLNIDTAELQKKLGCSVVVPVAARLEEGIDDLKNAVKTILDKKPLNKYSKMVPLPEPIRKAIQPVSDWFRKQKHFHSRMAQAQALRVVSSNNNGQFEEDGLSTLIETARRTVDNLGFPHSTLEATIRYHWLDQVVPPTDINIKTKTRSERIDNILTHPVLGPVIFIGILAFIFQSVFTWATVPMDWINNGISMFGDSVSGLLPAGIVRDLTVEGIIGGAGAILVFLPQILILIFFLALLEDSGYMARLAVMMDKAMTMVGLHGRSVLPLMIGYACAIPGIMSTRTINSWRERLVTILVTPLMSCSARIPVYALMIGAFVPAKQVWGFFGLQGLTLVLMYFLGTATALVLSLLFSRWIKADHNKSFIMELPPYRVPMMKSILRQVYTRGKVFITDAGKIIMVISICLWFLASFPRNETDSRTNPNIKYSYASKIGHMIEPVIQPLGFDWKIGIGLVTSFAAREVMVSTMATIYNVEGEGDKIISLTDALKNDVDPVSGKHVYTPLVALSLMVFYVYAAQCMATFAVVRRETNSWKWPLFMIVYMTGLAYFASLIVYQGGLWLGLA